MTSGEARALSSQPDTLLEVRDLKRYFDVSPPALERWLQGKSRATVKALDGVSFAINQGETFSLVGESGCGKSTVARLVVGLYQPTRGTIDFEGVDLGSARARAQHPEKQARMQMIFQGPYASLNPRWRVGDIIAEPIRFRRLISGRAAQVER